MPFYEEFIFVTKIQEDCEKEFLKIVEESNSINSLINKFVMPNEISLNKLFFKEFFELLNTKHELDHFRDIFYLIIRNKFSHL